MPRKRPPAMIEAEMTNPTQEYYTPQEVANLLRVDVMEVYRLRKDGVLPGVKFGHRTLRFKREDLDTFVSQHRDKSAV